MRNSTHQFMKTRSHLLNDVTPRNEFHQTKLEATNYINFDYNNLYRTSYNDMGDKVYLFK